MRHLRRLIAIALLPPALLTGSCGGDEPERRASEAPAEPQRIITLAPSLTEVVFALGLGDRVVGVSSYSRWPEAAREKPQLGGLIDPQLERIAALRPDLAILLPSQAEVAERLGGLGVETLVVPGETIGDVQQGIHAIARRCGVPRRGQRLLVELRRRLAPAPLPSAPRVLVVIGRQPGSLAGLTAAGPRTYFDELLRRLGARNVAAESPARYPQLSLEQLAAARPQVVLELVGDRLWEINRRERRADWQALPTLPAVENGCIEVIAADWALIPGPRLPRLYAAMREAIAGCPGVVEASGVAGDAAPRPREAAR